MKKYYFLFINLIYLFFVPNILNAQTPSITSFSPSSGAVGTLVTITGTNLKSPTAFSIGGVSALVISDTSIIASNKGDTLVGLVMPGATTGVVSVTTIGGTTTSAGNFTVIPTSYPTTQQGVKLVGTGAIGASWQGFSASISADGNTALVGGAFDNSNAGAAWIFYRSGGIWTQQGNKLIGTGAIGMASQGSSVSISADGNTAIVGGEHDNNIGAVWIYIRSGGTWKQQGNKLVGTGVSKHSYQGGSVSVSADGNTAIVGGWLDSNNTGAAWVFTRSGGIWTQQGSKLVGTGATGTAQQGSSVAISADGNTAIVCGNRDNNYEGAAWIFTRSGGTWTQQGNKLVGTMDIGQAEQGASVCISADGNTAIVGGYGDNNYSGAAWVYTRSGGIWTQQGNKLVGSGAIGASEQGWSVSISADGNIAIVGGYNDDNRIGAAWVYTRSGGIWTQKGSKLVGTGVCRDTSLQGSSIALSADGNTAIVGGFADSSNTGAAWVFTSDSTTGIQNISNKNSFILYPNPSIGIFTVQSSEDCNKSTVEVYNMLGEKIYTSKLNTTNTQINLSNNPDGIYLYRVVTETGGLISTGKMVIQK